MKKRVLFVCLGNICRSPSAEAVFTAMVEKAGVSSQFKIDSAGIGAWYTGEPADSRMQSHAIKRGYNLTSIARQFKPGDFDRFDYIIAMDDDNVRALKALARNEKDLARISKMTLFSKRYSYQVVPDPYYGGEEGFELVLDLLEDASEGLLETMKE